MKKFTNHTVGARGINLKNGTTRWIEPGQTVEIDPKEIVGAVPDLGKKTDTGAADAGEIDALRDQVTTLAKQVEDLTKERDELSKSNTTLAKQVEDLTKPADKKS